uniref:Aldo_ket_red domain-containing protein n=1 Tax=Panagrellus redivivus TaxID=6233 RepID=A0A7E4UPU7_PANRE
MASKFNVPLIPLSNGYVIPSLGFGTFEPGVGPAFKNAIRSALDAGYRYFDTAEYYRNESEIGDVLQEYYDAGKLKREDIYLTTKLPHYGHSEPGRHIEESLKRLRTDYIDLYLIHWPTSNKKNPNAEEGIKKEDGTYIPDLTPHIDVWRTFEKYYNDGKLKALGVSNFNAEQLQDLYDKATVKPHNLQVECHILFPQKEMFALTKKLNMAFTAYAPIGSPGRGVFMPKEGMVAGDPLKHPLTLKFAEKYNKTPAQILIRQIVQRGISAIPKSTKAPRIVENFNVFDFELTPEEMGEFDALPEEKRLFVFAQVKNHPWHPFPKDVAEVTGQ